MDSILQISVIRCPILILLIIIDRVVFRLKENSYILLKIISAFFPCEDEALFPRQSHNPCDKYPRLLLFLVSFFSVVCISFSSGSRISSYWRGSFSLPLLSISPFCHLGTLFLGHHSLRHKRSHTSPSTRHHCYQT